MEGLFQVEALEHLLNTAAHLAAGCIQVLHAERHFLLNGTANDLFVRVLQHRADLLCQIAQRQTCDRTSFQPDLSTEYASIAMWDKTIQAFEERTFSTPARTSNEQKFPFG